MINSINYPFLPPNRTFTFVALNDPWMRAAKDQADQNSACAFWPTGAVMVKDDKIIGAGANSGDLHFHCGRMEHHCPTGTGYEHCQALRNSLCHAEAACVNNALTNNHETTDADIYLFGHWWCCQSCWDIMIKAGVRNVYLPENAYLFFTRDKRLEVLEALKRNAEPTREDIQWEEGQGAKVKGQK